MCWQDIQIGRSLASTFHSGFVSSASPLVLPPNTRRVAVLVQPNENSGMRCTTVISNDQRTIWRSFKLVLSTSGGPPDTVTSFVAGTHVLRIEDYGSALLQELSFYADIEDTVSIIDQWITDEEPFDRYLKSLGRVQ